jgi:hypothetical protein
MALEEHIGMINMILDGCQPIFGVKSVLEGKKCSQFRELNEKYLAQLPDLKLVIIAARWPYMLEGYTNGFSEENFAPDFSSLSENRVSALSGAEGKRTAAEKVGGYDCFSGSASYKSCGCVSDT